MSEGLKSRVQSGLNAARKARDKERTLVLSTVLSDIKNREIEAGDALSDDQVLQVVSKAIKQRGDAADQMRGAGRSELADREEAQAAILKEFMPAALSEDDVRALVRDFVAQGADQMGAVMGRLMPEIRGRFDGKEANRIVREELGL
ncbi:MAG: GatB/YqeY domain-containing protein [Gemmatimonadetes bacterium]|nr:GatB/YqeY domain-containing protein [Gemmatimonadota bacterium]NNM33648.1 GatB/YqeY domain-containing protein [Gemmatimonadota bacterium]